MYSDYGQEYRPNSRLLSESIISIAYGRLSFYDITHESHHCLQQFYSEPYHEDYDDCVEYDLYYAHGFCIYIWGCIGDSDSAHTVLSVPLLCSLSVLLIWSTKKKGAEAPCQDYSASAWYSRFPPWRKNGLPLASMSAMTFGLLVTVSPVFSSA